MKAIKLFSVTVGFVLAAFCAKAQNEVPPLQYDMTFKGRGEATTVQSVTVENLSSGESLTLDGNKVLRLTNTPSPTGIEDMWNDSKPKVQSFVYPNPSYGQANLVFANRAAGNVTIGVYNLQGKMLTQGVFRLETGKHTATVPAMPAGNYIISMHGDGIKESVKWTSTGGGQGGNISLNGQIGEVDSKISAPKPQFISKTKKAEDIVEMRYADGELLRFTGENGNMTTIVMNIPTLSHDITFDFHECKDAAGYYYTIVNAGGILWMAEDLRNVPATVAPVRTSKEQWASYPADQPKQAFYNFNASNASEGGYYNHAGAKIALPAGWNLPTAGEVDYMLNKLGGYERAANKLKARGETWAQQQLNPDTVSFGATAHGFLTPEGVFNGEDFSVKYWTRSTKNAIPIFWGIENQNILLDAEVTASVGHGLRVRGCRPAPSAYDDIAALFRDAPDAASKKRDASNAALAKPAAKLFEDGPLGGAYVVSSEKKKLFIDYSYRGNAGEMYDDSYHFYHYDYTNGNYERNKMPNNGLGIGQYLKKSTAVKNSNSRENLVVATWNRPARFWDFQNSTAADFVYGAGTISLITYADSTQGYARVDSITLQENFTMGNHTISIDNRHPKGDLPFIHYETHDNYLSRFQVLAADFDNDGADEIVIHLDLKVVVYKKNGSNYTPLYTKTFAPLNNNNVRIAVGDADGDKTPDIAAIYEESAGSLFRVELYSAGDISQTPIAAGTFQNLNTNYSNENAYSDVVGNTFGDIKIGNVTGSGVNTIVAAINCFMNAPTVCLFEYDGTPFLKKLTTYSSGTSPVKEFDSFFEELVGVIGFTTINNNVTLVNFDGTGSRQDILAGVDILTYSGTGSGSLSKKTNSTIIPDVSLQEQLLSPFRFVFSDHVFAGNFNGNEQGKEQLSVITMIPTYADDPEIYDYWYAFYCGVEHKIYDVSGNTLNQTYKHNPTFPRVMGVGVKQHADGKHLNPLVNWQNASIPFTGIARSAEAARTLKYVGHTVTMTEPRIYALLAAPPFFKYKTNGEPLEYGGSTSMGTAWGATSTSGGGKANESAYRLSAIVGFEHEFNAPVLAINVGGFDVEAHIEFEWTGTEETEFETAQSIEWTVPNNDGVILSAAFTDSYEYEIISSENPDEIGGKINITIPSGEPRTMGLNLEDYNRLTADNPECPDLRQVFKHKVGYPFTYPNDKSHIKSNLSVVSGDPTQPTSQVLWATGGGSEFISTGSGNDVTLSIELTQTTVEATGFMFSADIEAVAKFPGGLKVGAGAGFSKGGSHSHIEGVGHGVAGTVPSPENINDTPSFQWTLGWYKYGIAVGNKTQEFPVVYYVVKP